MSRCRIPRVRVLERGRDVAADAGGLRHREVRVLVEDRTEAAALEQLEDHERDVVLAPVVDGDDVRMMQGRRDLGFGAEAAQERGVLGERSMQDLDRDAAAEAGVLGEVHPTARAGPDGRMQEIAAREDTTREVAHETSGHGDTR